MHQWKTLMLVPIIPAMQQCLHQCFCSAPPLCKPHALEQVAADFTSYDTDAATTHFKRKHTDSFVSVSGYALYRRDKTTSPWRRRRHLCPGQPTLNRLVQASWRSELQAAMGICCRCHSWCFLPPTTSNIHHRLTDKLYWILYWWTESGVPCCCYSFGRRFQAYRWLWCRGQHWTAAACSPAQTWAKRLTVSLFPVRCTSSFVLSAQSLRVTIKRSLHMPVSRCSSTNPSLWKRFLLCRRDNTHSSWCISQRLTLIMWEATRPLQTRNRTLTSFVMLPCRCLSGSTRNIQGSFPYNRGNKGEAALKESINVSWMHRGGERLGAYYW